MSAITNIVQESAANDTTICNRWENDTNSEYIFFP